MHSSAYERERIGHPVAKRYRVTRSRAVPHSIFVDVNNGLAGGHGPDRNHFVVPLLPDGAGEVIESRAPTSRAFKGWGTASGGALFFPRWIDGRPPRPEKSAVSLGRQRRWACLGPKK